MLSIEYKTIKKFEENQTKDKSIICVNGIDDENSFYGGIEHKYAHFNNSDVIDILLSHTFEDVGLHFSEIKCGWEPSYWENYIDSNIYCNTYYNESWPKIRLVLVLPDWEHWNKAWSMSNLASEFKASIIRMGNDKVTYWQMDEDSILNGFGVDILLDDRKLIIDTALDVCFEILEQLISETNENLTASISKDALLTYFKFPENTKTACKQYLIYFAQFLSDIGIEANIEITEEINNTLFKVIPENQNESLEKIKDALNIFLNTPNNKDFSTEIVNYNDIAVKQWEANIYHLKSQLSLFESTIQLKNASIEALQLSNYQYKQLLEKNKENNQEEIVPGVLSVKEYDGSWFSLNLPEILRKLKRLIR